MKHLRYFAAINTLDGETQYQEAAAHEITESYQARNPDGELIQYFVFMGGSYVAFPLTATTDNVCEDNLGKPQ